MPGTGAGSYDAGMARASAADNDRHALKIMKERVNVLERAVKLCKEHAEELNPQGLATYKIRGAEAARELKKLKKAIADF